MANKEDFVIKIGEYATGERMTLLELNLKSTAVTIKDKKNNNKWLDDKQKEELQSNYMIDICFPIKPIIQVQEDMLFSEFVNGKILIDDFVKALEGLHIVSFVLSPKNKSCSKLNTKDEISL